MAIRSSLGLVAAVWLTQMTAESSAQVPHHFTPGTPARASEVNENFDYLYQLLQTLTSPPSTGAGLALFDSNDKKVGDILDIDLSAAHYDDTVAWVRVTIPTSLQGETVAVPVKKSGVYGFGFGYGARYATTNCSGTAMVRSRREGAFATERVAVGLTPFSGLVTVIGQIPNEHFAPVSGGYPGACNSTVNELPLTPEFAWFPVESQFDMHAIYPPPYSIR